MAQQIVTLLLPLEGEFRHAHADWYTHFAIMQHCRLILPDESRATPSAQHSNSAIIRRLLEAAGVYEESVQRQRPVRDINGICFDCYLPFNDGQIYESIQLPLTGGETFLAADPYSSTTKLIFVRFVVVGARRGISRSIQAEEFDIIGNIDPCFEAGIDFTCHAAMALYEVCTELVGSSAERVKGTWSHDGLWRESKLKTFLLQDGLIHPKERVDLYDLMAGALVDSIACASQLGRERPHESWLGAWFMISGWKERLEAYMPNSRERLERADQLVADQLEEVRGGFFEIQMTDHNYRTSGGAAAAASYAFARDHWLPDALREAFETVKSAFWVSEEWPLLIDGHTPNWIIFGEGEEEPGLSELRFEDGTPVLQSTLDGRTRPIVIDSAIQTDHLMPPANNPFDPGPLPDPYPDMSGPLVSMSCAAVPADGQPNRNGDVFPANRPFPQTQEETALERAQWDHRIDALWGPGTAARRRELAQTEQRRPQSRWTPGPQPAAQPASPSPAAATTADSQSSLPSPADSTSDANDF